MGGPGAKPLRCRQALDSSLRDHALKPDRKKCPAVFLAQAFVAFSLKGIVAVRFHRLRQANAMRLQTDGAAKTT
jgi:hypothetical protein